MDLIGFHGVGLRTGEVCGVTLAAVPGPLTFVVDDLEVGRTEVTPRALAHRLALALRTGKTVEGVEHLMAALGGLGIQHGVRVTIAGPELPLLDASAFELALALRALGPPRDAPRLEVAQAGEVLAGSSRYSFEPKPSIDIAVEIEGGPGGRQRATWDGSPSEFIERLASARLHDAADPELQQVLRDARGADPATVLLLRSDGSAAPPGAAPGDQELARHRLLDFLADLYACGGPPRGRLRAFMPDHAATQHALRQALEFGLLVRR